jgi:hypothetical protein
MQTEQANGGSFNKTHCRPANTPDGGCGVQQQ